MALFGAESLVLQLPSALSVVQRAGATPLELPGDHVPSSPMSISMSPWAPSEAVPMSPWSPATPCVMSRADASMDASMSPVYAAGGAAFFVNSPRKAAPGSQLHTQRSFGTPQQALTRSAAAGAALGNMTANPSPSKFSPMCQSPGAEIRRNAEQFGIPLQLSAPGQLGAPLPVRAGSKMVMAPSPTTIAPPPPMPQPAGGTPVCSDGQPLPPGAAPPQLIRSVVTPFSSSRVRRARGGA